MPRFGNRAIHLSVSAGVFEMLAKELGLGTCFLEQRNVSGYWYVIIDRLPTITIIDCLLLQLQTVCYYKYRLSAITIVDCLLLQL